MIEETRPRKRLFSKLKKDKLGPTKLRVYWFPLMGDPAVRIAEREGQTFSVDNGTYRIREGSVRWIAGAQTVVAFEGIGETISMDLITGNAELAKAYNSVLNEHVIRELNSSVMEQKSFARDIMPWVIGGLMVLNLIITWVLFNGLTDEIKTYERMLREYVLRNANEGF